MKEFRKKWNKMGVDVPRDVPRDEAIARAYWKAALLWVLSNWDGKTDELTLALKIRDEIGGE